MALIAYVQRLGITSAEGAIRESLELSKTEMGWIFSGFYWSYAILQVPSGWLGDRIGSRWSLVAFSSICAITTGLLAAANGFWSLFFIRMAIGLGQAGLFPCGAQSITRWFPMRRRSFASGIFAAFMQFGGALATIAVGAALGEEIDWRLIFLLIAMPGVVWTLGFGAWFRDDPKDHASVNEAEIAIIEEPPAGPVAAAEGLVANEAASRPVDCADSIPSRESYDWPCLAAICGQQLFRAAASTFYASWFPTFLQETRGVSVGKAGILAALPLLMLGTGSILAGRFSDWLFDRTGSRRVSRQGMATISLLICSALIVPSWFIENPDAAVVVISISAFVSSFSGPVSYSTAMDLGGRNVGATFGLMNMFGNLGAAVFPILAGSILDEASDRMVGWNIVLAMFIAIHLIAAGIWLFVNPRMNSRGAK